MEPQLEISQLVKAELDRGRIKNARFSLRALARRAQVSPSMLSDIIAGKRRLTFRSAQRILKNLSIDPLHSQKILRKLGPVSRGGRVDQNRLGQRFNQLEMDQFHVLSDWHYFAVYILAELHGFQDDVKWIAKKLGIAKRDASIAVERLLNVGLFERDLQGKIRSVQKSITTTQDISDVAIRKRHHQNLERASTALDQVAVKERDYSSIVMASNPSKMEAAKRRIEQFRREFCQFLEDIPPSEKTEIYQLNLQFFPLTETKQRGE